MQPPSILRRWLAGSGVRPGKRQRIVHYLLDLFSQGVDQLQRHRAGQMAAALTFRTLFSLIPLTVCALLVVNAVGGFDEMGVGLRDRAVRYLNLDAIAASASREAVDETVATQPNLEADRLDTAAATNPVAATQPPVPGEQQLEAKTREKLQVRVDDLLAELESRIENISIAGIGVVGALVLIGAALALLVDVEACFNDICSVPRGRRWAVRVPVYWAVITLGPLLIAAGFVAGESVFRTLATVPGLPAVVSLLSPLSSFAATWLLLVIVYFLLPKARLKLGPVVVGAVVAALGWEVSKWAFRLYLAKALSASTLYGSLGLIPLFMMWVYLTWIIVLFGLELTWAMQTLPGERLRQDRQERERHARQYDPVSLIRVLAGVAQAFACGQPATRLRLSDQAGLTPTMTQGVLDDLHHAGMVHRVMADDEGEDRTVGYSLTRPPAQIRIADVLKLSHPPPSDDMPAIALLQTLRQAQQDAVGDLDLAAALELQTLDCASVAERTDHAGSDTADHAVAADLSMPPIAKPARRSWLRRRFARRF